MKIKNKFSKLSFNNKSKIIFKILKKIEKKKILISNKLRLKRIKIFFFYIKKHYPLFLKKVSLKKLIKKLKLRRIKVKTKFKVKKTLKQIYKPNHRFLTKKLKKILVNFPNFSFFSKRKTSLIKKFNKKNKFSLKTKIKKNLSRRTYFFKIIRKKRRRKLKVLRLNRNKPIFTKKFKKERKFLLRARDSLLKTKKFLYRKQFPKIKGKKNKNFNFFYYNNMDRIPFKFHIGRIVITYLLNNTFINIHSSKKMLKVLSAGRIGFKGPKRSTPYSRQVVARKAIKFIAKTKLNVLDVFLNSNYNRWYYFIFKEISKPKVKPYIIRYLIISNPRPHGFIRDRKHRRK